MKLLGEGKQDVLFPDQDLLQGSAVAGGEEVDHFADEVFRGRRSGGDADGLHARQPGGVDLGGAVDQVAPGAAALRHVHEPLGIGAVLGTDDEGHLGPPLGELLDGACPAGSAWRSRCRLWAA